MMKCFKSYEIVSSRGSGPVFRVVKLYGLESFLFRENELLP
jgi:hypothetical protein